MKQLSLISLLSVTFLTQGVLHAQGITDSLVILFAPNSYLISEVQTKGLNNWIETHNKQTIENISITGHTDADGSDKYNLALSQRRAEEVLGILNKKTFDGDKIKLSYSGEQCPVAMNNSDEGKQLNRRVTIAFSYKENNIEAFEKNHSDINDLFASMQDDIQQFCIDNKKDTILNGRQGTKIYIPANAFDCKLPHKDCIVIKLKECFENSEIIGERLSTFTTDHAVLQSAGMLWVEAQCEHRIIKLKEGSALTIFLPAENEIQPMKLYFANGEKENGWKAWFEGKDKINALPDNNAYVFAGRDIINGLNYGKWEEDCPFFFCRLFKPLREIAVIVRGPLLNQGDIAGDEAFYGSTGDQFRVQNGWAFDSTNISTQILKLEFGLSNSKVYNQMMYVAKTAGLGWINYDCLWTSEPVVQKVNVKKDVNTSVMMIFKDKKGVLPANDDMEFIKIPADEPVYVIGIKYFNDKIFFAKTETQTASGSIDLTFNEISRTQLTDELKALNN